MMDQMNTSGQNLQKWFAVQVVKMHRGAYAEAAEKLGCEPEKEAIHTAIRNLYDTEKRASEIIHAVDENQARLEKSKKRQEERNMKKSRKRRLEAAEQQRQTKLEASEMEYKIQECEEELAEAKAAYEASDKELAISKYESERVKEEVLDIQERLKKLYQICDEVEAKARIAAEEMAKQEERILSLSEELVKLKKQHAQMTALHFTLEEACASETCKRVYWNTEAHQREVQNVIMEIMTDISGYPKDFQEMIGLANRQEIRRIAEVLAYNKQLGAQYPGKALVWHFSKREDTVSDLLEFAGLSLKIENMG